MRRDPSDNEWIGRDRFILSAGHSSLTQYVQLYFGGYGLELDDLKALRTWGSKTPGHPEYGHTDGVEITTGPLGQGLSSAVGFAYAAALRARPVRSGRRRGHQPVRPPHLRDRQRRRHRGGHHPARRARSPATSSSATSSSSTTATRSRSRTTPTSPSREDVAARYEAYGWHVQTVDWKKTGQLRRRRAGAVRGHRGGAGRHRQAVAHHPEDDHRLAVAEQAEHRQDPRIRARRRRAARPSRRCSASIPAKTFVVADDVIAHTRKAVERGKEAHAAWQKGFDAWATANPDRKKLLDRILSGALPDGVDARPAGVRGRQGRVDPRRQRQGAERPRPGHPRALGRLGRPRRVEQHDHRGRAVVHPEGALDARVDRATRTAACCTSASASTRWARSSTASCCTATRARSAARS